MADLQGNQELQTRAKVSDQERRDALRDIVNALDERRYPLEGWRDTIFECQHEDCKNSEGRPFAARPFHHMLVSKNGGAGWRTPALWCCLDEDGDFKIVCVNQRALVFNQHGIICVPFFKVLEALEARLETECDPVTRHVTQIMGTMKKCSLCRRMSSVGEQFMVSSQAHLLLCGKKQNEELTAIVSAMSQVLNSQETKVSLDFGSFYIPPTICRSCVEEKINVPAAKILPINQDTQKPQIVAGGVIKDLVVEPRFILKSIFRKIESGRHDQYRGKALRK